MCKSPETQVGYPSEKNENKSLCGFIVVPVMLLGLAAPLIILSVQEARTNTLEEFDCSVSHIEYPKSISDNQFVECDCGRNCFSDKGICIKIYVTHHLDNTTVLLENSLFFNRDSANNCTISETRCMEGEQFSDRIETVNNIPTDYEEYFHARENNGTFNCYIDPSDNTLYLNANSVLEIIITLSFLMLVCVIVCLLFGCNGNSHQRNS